HYGRILVETNDLDLAEQMLSEALRKLEATVGAEHKYTGLARSRLIALYEETGREDEAAALKK
ncbi:MAG: hypothetical protein ACPGXK_16270, partial [Phycisphaerae bacterium]